jgi:hypothetical protein
MRNRLDGHHNQPHHRRLGAILDVNSTLATGLIDRLMRHGETFVIHGGSYRMKDRYSDIETPQ